MARSKEPNEGGGAGPARAAALLEPWRPGQAWHVRGAPKMDGQNPLHRGGHYSQRQTGLALMLRSVEGVLRSGKHLAAFN